jgi:hypothetical protein
VPLSLWALLASAFADQCEEEIEGDSLSDGDEAAAAEAVAAEAAAAAAAAAAAGAEADVEIKKTAQSEDATITTIATLKDVGSHIAITIAIPSSNTKIDSSTAVEAIIEAATETAAKVEDEENDGEMEEENGDFSIGPEECELLLNHLAPR